MAISRSRARRGARAWAPVVAGLFFLVAGCRRPPAPPNPDTLGQLDPAVKSLINELTAAVKAKPADAQQWGRLAMAFEANDLLVQAAQAYEVAVGMDAREPRWRYLQSLLKSRRGDTAAALADLQHVVNLAPDYVPARWRLGLSLLDRGETDQAEAAFRMVVQMAPDQPAGPIGLARVHLSRRQDAEAASVLEALLARSPGERYAQHLLGTAYQRLGRDEQARFALTVGSTGEPTWVDPWSDEVYQYRRGFAALIEAANQLKLDRRFDDAITLLKRACAERPDDRGLLVYLGGMYASAGRMDDAAAILEPVLAADPTDFKATMHLASGYLSAGALDKAAAYAGRALALRPSSAVAAKLRGVINWQQGHVREAEGFFEMAAEADPRDPMPHLWMGMILRQQAKYLAARTRFETALSKNPLLGEALIGVADTYAATGAFAEAQAALKRAEQAEPDNPRLADARARIGAAAKAAR
jgi:tetratricopeptide (TPR) repeat protein